MCRVIIIEKPAGRTRGEEFAKKCGECRPDVEIYTIATGRLKKYCRGGYFDVVEEIPDYWDLALRHYERAITETYRFAINARKEIWYGGGGADLSQGKEWNIHRALRSAEDVRRLEDHILLELLNWALAENQENLKVPSLLRPQPRVEVISTLIILCQGFVAVHACYAGTEKNWSDADLVEALRQMGGADVVSGLRTSLIRTDLGKEKRIVREAAWWLAPFGLWDMENQAVSKDDKKRDRFKTGIEEWYQAKDGEVPEVVRKLAETILAGREVQPPKMVADAFLELCAGLGLE